MGQRIFKKEEKKQDIIITIEQFSIQKEIKTTLFVFKLG